MNLPWLNTVRAEFQDRLSSGRLAHALLLSGPPGTGKGSLADEWVASLLCIKSSTPACGECRSCQLRASGAHPDCRFLSFEINEKSGKTRTEIVIDQIRSLIASMQLTTTISDRKVALVRPAEALNRSAANALLKTLEEPPGNAVILLVSDDPGALPATIRSRCQNLVVRMPDRADAQEWIMTNGSAEPGDAALALAAAAGSPLVALELLEDGGLEHYRLLQQVLDELVAGSAGRAVGQLHEIDQQRLWLWLSLVAAQSMRENLEHNSLAMELSQLQRLADRNRYLLASPVRKDFLLQDWLIQWAQLNV